MTTQDIISIVVNNLNRSDFTRPMALGYINERVNAVCDYDNYSFMELTATAPTVAGQQTYDIPSTYKDQLQMLIIDGVQKTPLIKWVGTEAELSFSNTTTSTKPYAYWVWQNAYNVYPIPDKAYTLFLKYYGYLGDMTDVAIEENELGQYWYKLLENGATAEAFHFFQQADKTTEWEAKYQSEFKKMDRRYNKRKTTNYIPRMRVRVK